MKTYSGTVVCKIYREVTIEVEDGTEKDNIEYAMIQHFHDHNLKPEDMETEVWDIEQVDA
jgi:hypothetical protein